MSYTRFGPFTDNGAPGISAAFLNDVEDFLVQLDGEAVTSTDVGSIVRLTRSQYEGLSSPDPDTLYIVEDD